jgi:DNA invertase Pin-like site-specific DNA recombinase
MQAVSEDDVLVVWKLDRLGRSLPHLLELVSTLKVKGAGFRSLSEAMDTTTPGGTLIFHVMGALAEFERSLIIERTRSGMKAARERGRKPGPKPKLTTEQIAHARQMIEQGSHSPSVMASLLQVDRSTLWRALKRGY